MTNDSVVSHDKKPWAEIRSLLEGVRVNLEGTQNAIESADAAILKKRARDYAVQNGRSADVQSAQEDVLLVSLGEDTYGIPCESIEEVIPMQNLVALPHTSRYILGISSNRGVLLAVVDLKRVLNIPASDLTTMHRVIVIRHELCQVGFLVDAVHGMRTIDPMKMKVLPPEVNERTQRFIRGLSDDNARIMNPLEIVNEIAETEPNSSGALKKQNREQHIQVPL